MNLYLRLCWTLFRGSILPAHSIYEPIERTFRVLPNDVDINGHMNNGRYLTILDLMLVEFFTRTGYVKVLLTQGWRPMSGGAIITHRRGLKPFQKYRIHYEWASCDAHWNFMKFSFVTMDGRLCAAGYMKGAAVSSEGLVENQRSFDLLGVQLEHRPASEAVSAWMQSEKQLVQSE